MHENVISELVIAAAIEVHRTLGPGLLESVYEESLCQEFRIRGIHFERQQAVPIDYKGTKLATDLRLDLLVEGKVIVDVKAKEKMTEKDHAKTLTYLYQAYRQRPSMILRGPQAGAWLGFVAVCLGT